MSPQAFGAIAIFHPVLFATLSAVGSGIALSALSFAANKFLGAKIDTGGITSKQTVQIKSSEAPWKIAYGKSRVSGNVTHLGSTNGKSVFHIVLTLASHTCKKISGIYLDEHPHYYNDLTSDYFDREVGGDKGKSYIAIDGYGTGKMHGASSYGKANGWVNNKRRRLAQYVYFSVQKSIGGNYVGTPGVPENDVDINGNGVWPLHVSSDDVPYNQILGWKPEAEDPAKRLCKDNVDATGWTKASFIQKNHSKLYIKTRFGSNKFSGGFPNYSAILDGKEILNLNTSVTEYSSNPSYAIYDYLTTSRLDGGLGVNTANIDSASFITAANICEESIAKQSRVGHSTYNMVAISKEDRIEAQDAAGNYGDITVVPLTESDTVDDEILFRTSNGDQSGHSPIVTGDGIDFSGTPAFGLSTSTTYYAIITRWESDREHFLVYSNTEIDTKSNNVVTIKELEEKPVSGKYKYWRMQIATTRRDAHLGNAITLSPTSPEVAGSWTMNLVDEQRYTLNGLVDTSMNPVDILQSMLSSMAGELYHTEGKWRIRAGAWVAPTIEFTEDDIVGPVKVLTKSSASERINAVKGKYISLATSGKHSDYPPVENSLYLSEDDGIKQFGELDLFYTNSKSMAQRIAKIHLEQSRQDIVVELDLNLSGMQVTAGDNIELTLDRFGWEQKEFNVKEWELKTQESGITIHLKLAETASGIFDWNNGDETIVDLAPNTTLPDAFELSPPQNLQISSSQDIDNYVDHVVAKVTLTWEPAEGEALLIDKYRISYRLSTTEFDDSDWIVWDNTSSSQITNTTNGIAIITSLELGTYDFSVVAVTQDGIESEMAIVEDREISVISTIPLDVTNFTGVPLGAKASLQWDLSTEDEVLKGGKVLLRHTVDQVTPSWNNSVVMATLDGTTVKYEAPLKSGTYMAKFKNNTGSISENAATFFITQDNAVVYGNIEIVTENSQFLGDKNHCEVADGILKLSRTIIEE